MLRQAGADMDSYTTSPVICINQEICCTKKHNKRSENHRTFLGEPDEYNSACMSSSAFAHAKLHREQGTSTQEAPAQWLLLIWIIKY
ncbi:hypothetical protein Y1Q_0007144 [Alligator mississippiensis]|uniref:Uncharacterized protein n=1 Tax=Alligator mississippiensis TaxID=8496 RepID=A0A151N608_ALLMI|nr:hypothetical protein Y1Q_0007144 [Alligator mississippiensis]